MEVKISNLRNNTRNAGDKYRNLITKPTIMQQNAKAPIAEKYIVPKAVTSAGSATLTEFKGKGGSALKNALKNDFLIGGFVVANGQN